MSKLFFYDMNIHDTTLKGPKKSSIEYNLSLFPHPINHPDKENNTPVHFAALGNQKKMLFYFKKKLVQIFQFRILTDFLPIHLISNKTVMTIIQGLGFDLNERNSNGESLLDKSMIKAMPSFRCCIFLRQILTVHFGFKPPCISNITE